MIDKTSKEFMEGFIFQFPDFDDPALNEPQINFKKPNEFYAEYAKRYGEGRMECGVVGIFLYHGFVVGCRANSRHHRSGGRAQSHEG